MSDSDPDEFLNWLCWMWAQDGERFYPPDETAQECMDALDDDHYEEGSDEYHEALGWEKGKHARAYTEAVTKFRDAKRSGFDPIERAAREQHDLRQRVDDYDEQIDWSWLTDKDQFIENLANLPEQ